MKSKIYSLSILTFLLFNIGVFAQCTITSGPNVTYSGLTILVTGTGTGASAPSYIYNWGDSNPPSTGPQNSSHTYATPGTYQLFMIYTDLNNPVSCSANNFIYVTVPTVGIANQTGLAIDITATPNPFHSAININLSTNTSEHVEMLVYDLTGKQIASLKNGIVPAGTSTINWEPTGISEGIYLLQIKSGDNVITKKIIYSGK